MDPLWTWKSLKDSSLRWGWWVNTQKKQHERMQMTWNQAANLSTHTCLCYTAIRTVMMARSVLRTPASETVATTAGTQRGASLFLPPDTQGTTLWTGERYLLDIQLIRTWVKISFFLNICCHFFSSLDSFGSRSQHSPSPDVGNRGASDGWFCLLLFK